MAIGRFRDDPAAMDELEQRIAAAQYPEGGLAVGGFAGVIIALLTVEVLVVLAPFAGMVVGFLLGRRYREAKLAALRASEGE